MFWKLTYTQAYIAFQNVKLLEDVRTVEKDFELLSLINCGKQIHEQWW